ncbi:Hypothetical predicted protein [Xyrichtys novacula]|uniref:Uncharacterized protein n=1 Tax=Xyrichtys novacula TaxID=13765 RepID=A0AAV1GHA4_XYRNO|nr:Hypothetical predicted protein [Xyrichtys novacula]
MKCPEERNSALDSCTTCLRLISPCVDCTSYSDFESLQYADAHLDALSLCVGRISVKVESLNRGFERHIDVSSQTLHLRFCCNYTVLEDDGAASLGHRIRPCRSLSPKGGIL